MGFVAAIENALPADAVVSDMCIPGYWLGGFHRTPAPRKLCYPLGWGTLGCAFPQGLGAALAGEGPAVSISGDGGFLRLRRARGRKTGEHPAHGRGRGRRLRDDPLRPGPARRPAWGSTSSTRTSSLARLVRDRADHVDGLGEHFAMALKGHVALREPTLLVAREALGPPPNVSPRWYRR